MSDGTPERSSSSGFAVPFAAISLGTSKLYHYTYPFLPPLALAAGSLPAALLERNGPVRQILRRGIDWMGQTAPARRVQAVPALRWTLIGLATAAFVIAVVTAIVGPFRLGIGSLALFRNSSTVRPVLVGSLLLALAGQGRIVPNALLIPILILTMPLTSYREITVHLARQDAHCAR